MTNVKKFLTATETKKISFLQHYQQTGGSANAQNNLPISVLKRGPVTYFSINYSLHSNFYNFFDAEKTLMIFLRLKNKKLFLQIMLMFCLFVKLPTCTI